MNFCIFMFSKFSLMNNFMRKFFYDSIGNLTEFDLDSRWSVDPRNVSREADQRSSKKVSVTFFTVCPKGSTFGMYVRFNV